MHVNLCPTCNRPLAHPLRHLLSDTETKIVDIIAAAGGRGITQKDIADKLYSDRIDGGPLNTRNAIGVYLHNIRKKLVGSEYLVVCRGHHYMIGKL